MRLHNLIFAGCLVCASVLARAADLPAVAAPAASTAEAVQGYELRDPERGMVLSVPANWSINASKSAVSLMNDVVYDALVILKKSWFTVTTAEEAFVKTSEGLKRFLPGAEMIKDKESLKLGNTDAMSMTYRDPSQQKVHREIVFVHRGVSYELSFTVKEENFGKVKDDFGKILRGIELF